jgi:hypothetical protein
MADDLAAPLNPLVAPVDKEKFEETSFDEVPLEVNVSQRSCEEGCALESIVRHGIVDYLLTHMPWQFI